MAAFVRFSAQEEEEEVNEQKCGPDEPDDPNPTPDPDFDKSAEEDMACAEDAEQGIVARKRAKRAGKIRVRRK